MSIYINNYRQFELKEELNTKTTKLLQEKKDSLQN